MKPARPVFFLTKNPDFSQPCPLYLNGSTLGGDELRRSTSPDLGGKLKLKLSNEN